MWITLRTAFGVLATALFVAALFFVLPRVNAQLPHHEASFAKLAPSTKTPIDEAMSIVNHADRVRAQRMQVGNVKLAPPGTAVFESEGLVAKGAAITPKGADAEKLVGLVRKSSLKNAMDTSPYPHFVVRFAQGDERTDFLVDPTKGAIVVQLNHRTVAVLDAKEASADLKDIEASLMSTP